MDGYIPARLQEIIDDFGYCEGQEKLEYLRARDTSAVAEAG